MLQIIKIVSALIVIIISGYQLITSSFQLQPYVLFIAGIMLVVMGIEEFQKQHKSMGYLLICTSASIFLVVILTLVFK